MKKKTAISLILTVFIPIAVFAQESSIRPYKLWDKIAFCAFSSYHPLEYTQSDNNWEILLTLRTPMSTKQLDSLGVKYTDSQLMFLNIGGLIENKNNQWHTTMPIYEKPQTIAIRKQSKEIAQLLYAETKEDWDTFMEVLAKRDWNDHAFSFAFSFILDGKIWGNGLLPDHKDLTINPTWDGTCWALYNKRPNSSCGTNTYYEKFCQTWTDELSYWMGSKTITKFLKAYEEKGKIEDKELIDTVVKWGLTDKEGNIIIPIIDENSNDDLIQIRNIIMQKLAKGVKRFSPAFASDYQLDSEKLAQVILYHEIMWDILDILLEKKVFEKPEILKGNLDAKKADFKNIVYILK